jgi:hypothetical protein
VIDHPWVGMAAARGRSTLTSPPVFWICWNRDR